VLVVAGDLLQKAPDDPEDDILMRALRDFNIAKIVKVDEVVFFGLLGDLFPGIDPPRKIDEELEGFVRKGAVALGNDPDPEFCLKVVQTEELLSIRHCVFVMGPPAAGKSQCWRTLQKARELQGPDRKTKIVDLNPKSIKTEELYGFISMATREWKDGLLSKIMRDIGQIPDEKPKWIMLDGDLDANWIESMNSVMDDNKMLTLASNERIPVKPHMKLVFEIRDLKHATPATTSRAGILYISTDEGSQWRSLIKSWIGKNAPERGFSEELTAKLKEYFEEYVDPTLLWLKVNAKAVIPLEDMNLVTSFLWMLDGTLDKTNTADEEQLEIVFVFCFIWAVGAGLCVSDDGTDYKKLFSDWWRNEWKNVKFPSRETVFDYWLDPSVNGFEQWTKSPYFFTIDYNSTTPMGDVTVPTPETCSVSFWMEKLVDMRRPVMLAGPAGTGKTQMIQGLLNSFKDPSVYVSCNINFNFYTTSQVLFNTMSGPLEKKTGTNFGPPGNAKLIYFVDDINLPEVDKYMTQSAIALLRQQLEYEHVYDLTKLAQNPQKNISKTQMMSCMNPTAGSNEINPRLQRNFVTFAIGLPGPTSLLTIYQTFLDGHLKNFNADVKGVSSNMIKAALGLHTMVSQTFRKTAANFHYEFNIRHLSNVFQGLLVAQPDQFETPEKFVHLWLHESERVYGDRLVCAEDLKKYNELAQSQAKKLFSQFSIAKFYAAENADPLLFCHFAENIQDKCYDQVINMSDLSGILEDALAEYNEMNAVMDLVLFEDAMKHICRIVRIVLNVGGHALLVGVGGSGKQSLSRLSAFICSYTVIQIVISSSYSLNDLKDDLKIMYTKAGLKEEGVMFLLTDSQITNERFLIYINDLLASGNIPDLFANDEVDGIVGAVTNRVKATGVVPDRKNCWDFYIGEIRRNLHVVLAFSPVGDDFRNRARKFPAIVNCTVIDWFQPWPKEALFSVGRRFLSGMEMGEGEGPSSIRGTVEAFLPESFAMVQKAADDFKRIERRFVYMTPKSFLELLKLYQVLLEHKREEADAAIIRLANGLLKLKETAEAVGKIEEDLKVSLEEADIKKTTAEGIAEVVSKEKAIVEVETANGEAEEIKVVAIQNEVAEKAASTQADLAKAEPAVEAAMAALNTLDPKALGECKTMVKPPAGVDDVFASTMCLLAGYWSAVVHKGGKVKDRSWDAAKKQCLGNIKEYIEQLKLLKVVVDESKMNANNVKEAKPYLELAHFTPEIIAGKNSAAAGLCSFVINIVTYYEIVVTVEPKRIALAQANQQLSEANARLAVVQANVKELQEKLAKLTTELNAANAEKQNALDTVERGQRKLDLATRLTNALASENERWGVNIEVLRKNKELLIGDVMLASAFISYVGPFTKPFRDKLMMERFTPYLIENFTKATGDVEKNPISPAADVVSILATPAEIATWNSDGLPADTVSTENGTIVSNTARWPLMIDPQLQGIAWIRQKESSPARNLQIVRLGQGDMTRKLERALENGHSILLENLGESIDAVLNPVIQRATIKRGRNLYVKLGDSEVEFHENFRLYLHTKLSNPHYPPEIQAETTLVNFTVTITGLEDQLLVRVVGKERADLAKLADELIKQQNAFKIKMNELEDNILNKLATAEGDITEDVALIEGLEESKRISTEIMKKSAIALETQGAIKVTSEKYRSAANRSSLLFFLMNDLSKIHSYYIYSLSAFLAVFYRGIDLVTTKPEVPAEGEEPPEEEEEEEGAGAPELTDEELAERCIVLIDSITLTVFNYLRRGLFEVDKLTVATLLTLKIGVNDGLLNPEEIEYLTLGKQASDPGNMGPLHEWLPETLWPKLKALEGLKRFSGLGDNMQSDTDEWAAWFENEKSEEAKLPGDYQKQLSTFDRLILLRAVRPDRITTALRDYVGDVMGNDYVYQKPYDMAATYEETTNQSPVFFVLFPGVDPTPWVEGLGMTLGISTELGNFCNISMGQGQEKPAETIVDRFAKEGGWVMLQNCHLMTSWVPRLERLLEIVQEYAHDNFRCYISAEPPGMAGKNMPESLLQSCVKVANEAPADIKSNVTRAWDEFTQERIDGMGDKAVDFKACLFSTCWFHAIVLGRRRFGPQGWSRKYSFNTGDLTICANVLESYLLANPVVPWDDLRYIFGEIMYGGHITDAWDRRTNNVYLEVLLNPELYNGLELGPGFKSPDPNAFNYNDYLDYTQNQMPPETPPAFGLHPNAEIGYLTNAANALFVTIMAIAGGSGGDGGGGGSAVKGIMEDLTNRLPENFEMITTNIRAKPLLPDPSMGPYVVCALQECTRMNVLFTEIRRSLIELDKGLKGQVNMSEPMEDLVTAMKINEWPGRNPYAKCVWEKYSWWSKKGLISQFADMLNRQAQMEVWSSDFATPISVWLPGLFNPMAYNTAITQVTARRTGNALDKMASEVHVTTMLTPDKTKYEDLAEGKTPEDGMYVHGLFIEGARWPTGDEIEETETVGWTTTAGALTDSKLKELMPPMPVLYIKAVTVQSSWEPSAVGYLRHLDDIYEAPVYVTTMRGPTYLFIATLKTLVPTSRWVLTGTAVMLQTDD
jgi:dynein heavy chain